MPLSYSTQVKIKKNVKNLSVAVTVNITSEIDKSVNCLFENAIEAMEDGGTLTICLNNQMDKLIIDIIDTGIGISEEEFRKIGKPFFSTKGDKDTGLGMMTTFNIIKRMNGVIHLASKVGVGTTFTLSFPIFDDKKQSKNKLNKSHENSILLKI
ncbi:ATP-binding protein [Neobacillus terrae]|uniref:ATP-binding protein n=1 Tax=Neobacillus terrae TaxID=3034837 RepID=UPI00140811BE|nr:ATP-binding protein [Neobacillus terrae]NHM33464.1 hypothetical protein [Neobacillus terrae]